MFWYFLKSKQYPQLRSVKKNLSTPAAGIFVETNSRVSAPHRGGTFVERDAAGIPPQRGGIFVERDSRDPHPSGVAYL
jgi:hypothetical protein